LVTNPVTPPSSHRHPFSGIALLRAVAAKGGRGRLSDAEYEGIEIAAEEEWLFPDWKVYVRGSGVIQWSQAISKSWQYVKTKLGLKRGGVTFYSARHSFKGFIDDIRGLSLRSSRVLMGHSTEDNVPNSYGPKTITESQMEILLTLSSESINQISAILISAKERAERGELKIIDAWRIDRRAKDAALQAALAEREEWYRT
jgi:integrase